MFVPHDLPPSPVFPGMRDTLRAQPSLLDPLDNGQVNALQLIHKPVILSFGLRSNGPRPPINWFHKRVGTESAGAFPRLKPPLIVGDEVPRTH
jgi:hypothetical protein